MIPRFIMRSKSFKWASSPRLFSEGSGQTHQGSSSTSQAVNANVPGLSEACVHPASKPVGPNVEPSKTGAYKVPEYFCYDNTSYFEAEVEMSKFRLPQPSALKK